VTRARSLFDLAHLCGVTPPETYRLTVGDFGCLLAGIRAHKAARPLEP
jgi:hypothetical protein